MCMLIARCHKSYINIVSHAWIDTLALLLTIEILIDMLIFH